MSNHSEEPLNTRMPWWPDRRQEPTDVEMGRPIRPHRPEDHARKHPISDSGVQQHSLLTTEWEPNRPAAPFTGDLVQDTFEKPSYVAVVVIGFCMTMICVTITWMIVAFRGGF